MNFYTKTLIGPIEANGVLFTKLRFEMWFIQWFYNALLQNKETAEISLIGWGPNYNTVVKQ